MSISGQPSVIPFRPTDTRDISLKRRTITGKIVKEIFFKVKSRTAPRSAKRPLGIAAPSVEECLNCIPTSEYPFWRVAWNTITCGWFYIATAENGNEGQSGIYELISVLALGFAILVKSVLSDAKDIHDDHLRGLCVLFCSLSLFFLVSSSFYAMAHVVLTQKMKLDSQVDVFNRLYFAPLVRVFSPIRFLQYGIHTGGFSGILWVCGFVEKPYSITFGVLFCFLLVGTWIGFLRLVYAALGVLDSEPLREGEQASLDAAAIKILLQAYEEDCGAEFMNPQGFATFCGECLLKPGCDPSELCEFSYVTKMRMDRLLEQHLISLANAVGDENIDQKEATGEANVYGTILSASVVGKVEASEAPKVVNIKSALKSAEDAIPEPTQRSISPTRQLIETSTERKNSADQTKRGSKGVQGTRRKVKKGPKVSFQGQGQELPLVDTEGDSSGVEPAEEHITAPLSEMQTSTTRGSSNVAGHNVEDGVHYKSADLSNSSAPLSPTEVYTNHRSSLSAQLPPANI